MKRQSYLDTYFIPEKPSNMMNFVYEPEKRTAYFTNEINEKNDRIICVKLSIKFYLRKTHSFDTHTQEFPKLYIGEDKLPVQKYCPLLKSNLQKAIRRRETEIAVQSGLAILQSYPIELLRRLGIIYIEDVCLMESYTIIMWMMMVEHSYELTPHDWDTILQCIISLCECSQTYPDSHDCCKDYLLDHKSILREMDATDLQKSCVLGLHYRSKYGGMKGDMVMLKESIYYYIENPNKIAETKWKTIPIDYFRLCTYKSNPYQFDYYAEEEPCDTILVSNSVDIIPEAIDFHCYPQMLTFISNKTGIDSSVVRKCIWYAVSGVNDRKPITKENSKEAMKTDEWEKIKRLLPAARSAAFRYENI